MKGSNADGIIYISSGQGTQCSSNRYMFAFTYVVDLGLATAVSHLVLRIMDNSLKIHKNSGIAWMLCWYLITFAFLFRVYVFFAFQWCQCQDKAGALTVTATVKMGVEKAGCKKLLVGWFSDCEGGWHFCWWNWGHLFPGQKMEATGSLCSGQGIIIVDTNQAEVNESWPIPWGS